MNHTLTVQRLTEVGFSKYEACAYLALLGHDDSTAVEVADRAGVPRQRIYDVLESLRAKELVMIREGRPVRHTACPPAAALSALLAARQRQQAAENARLEQLIHSLLLDLEKSLDGEIGNGSASLLTRILNASQQSIGGL
jgi:sugar-specific transcriptional regulator TrmB